MVNMKSLIIYGYPFFLYSFEFLYFISIINELIAKRMISMPISISLHASKPSKDQSNDADTSKYMC